MKKLLLMVAVAAMATTVTFAQNQPPTNQNPTNQSPMQKDKADWEKQVRTDLNLTPEQTMKFDAIGKDYESRLDAITQDATLNSSTREERKTALKKEKETKLFEFFTPEQQTKYREMMEKKKKDKGVKP